jgi:hypothetical protein
VIREFIQGRIQSLTGGNSVSGEVGIGGFTLFARVSDAASYTAQIPTQVLEDGSIAADHIINDPLTFTISGDVSDTHIRLAPPLTFGIPSDSAAGQVVALLPNRTQSQLNKISAIGQSVMDAVDRADRLINIGQNVFDAFNPSSSSKPLREQFVDFVESVYYGKQLITVDAAYRTHENMGITSLTINRDNQNDSIRFEIVVQKVEFVELIYTDIQQFYKAPAPAAKASVAGKTEQGAQNKTAESGSQTKSLASAILGR